MCDLVVKTNGTVIWSNLVHIGKIFGIWPRQWLKVSKSVRCMRIVIQVIKRYVILISYLVTLAWWLAIFVCGSRHCLVKWTARAIWEQEELVGGLEHFFIFPYIGNNHPNWLSYFSEGWLNHQAGNKSLCEVYQLISLTPRIPLEPARTLWWVISLRTRAEKPPRIMIQIQLIATKWLFKQVPGLVNIQT